MPLRIPDKLETMEDVKAFIVGFVKYFNRQEAEVLGGGTTPLKQMGYVLQQLGSGEIKDANILTAHLEDLAVTTAKLANLAVTAAKIGALAVETAKIDDLAVTAAKIAALTITAAKIANLTIEAAQIANLTITAAKIENGIISDSYVLSNDLSLDNLIKFLKEAGVYVETKHVQAATYRALTYIDNVGCYLGYLAENLTGYNYSGTTYKIHAYDQGGGIYHLGIDTGDAGGGGGTGEDPPDGDPDVV